MPGSDRSGVRALIVGGTAGVGLASACHLLKEGARELVIVGRTPERGRQAARALSEKSGSPVHFIACDASQADQVEKTVKQAAEKMGGLDFLLSCAANDPMPRLLHDIPTGDVMDAINRVQAPIILPARVALDIMSQQQGGSIACFASDAGKVATPGETPIGAAMASIIMFCRAMANEVKRNGIRVNCVTPSVVRGTPLYDALMADEFCGKIFGRAEQLASLGVVEPDDLAQLVGFLASPRSSKMTGQTISVTGGISAV